MYRVGLQVLYPEDVLGWYVGNLAEVHIVTKSWSGPHNELK